MQWFAGNVQTAIQISRKNQALLVVYITNDTADGRLFDSFWDQIDTSILSCAFVGIKLKAGETAAQQFADICELFNINHENDEETPDNFQSLKIYGKKSETSDSVF